VRGLTGAQASSLLGTAYTAVPKTAQVELFAVSVYAAQPLSADQQARWKAFFADVSSDTAFSDLHSAFQLDVRIETQEVDAHTDAAVTWSLAGASAAMLAAALLMLLVPRQGDADAAAKGRRRAKAPQRARPLSPVMEL
jgi:hypothetical protein